MSKKLNILLVGSGGREHALAWKMTQSPFCGILYCAPGNAGIADVAKNVAINADDVDEIVSFAKNKNIDLVVIGPEAPLVLGLADMLRDQGIGVFGCSQKAAQLEGSKAFMKDLCKKYDIPTAEFGRFTDLGEAIVFLQGKSFPIVLKTSGLAAGKGVIIAQTYEDAVETAESMLSGERFGDAGQEIVIEEFLVGEELSYFALSDGETVLPLTSAQDHKQVFDGDKGPNTGGMGAYSPAHLMTDALEQKIIDRIIEPTIRGMKAEGCAFSGVLFAGIMVVDGEPILLEHNVRFGDPECQTLMARFDGNLVSVLEGVAQGRLNEVKDQISWIKQSALCVVMASNGYPDAYAKNSVIRGIAKANKVSDVVVFHAGTARNNDNEFVNIGGRVLGVTALGDTIKKAQENAYEGISNITWPDGFCRSDIGWRAVEASA